MATIARRHVFHLAGYDPIDIDGQHRRFRRELAKFAATWGIQASASDMVRDGDGARWSASARGPNWAVETVYEPLDWHDIVQADIAVPMPHLLWTGFVAFFDIVVTGTVFRYFSASHRYALFFLVPFAYVAVFAGLALAAALAAVDLLIPQAGGIWRGGVAVVPALGLFALLLRWPGRWLGVAHGLADWAFAHDYMRGRRPDIEARLGGFCARIVARSHASGIDEILLVGHSLGAILLVDAMESALRRGLGDARLAVLTVGATIPKIALHPAGRHIRDCAARLAAAPEIFWAEYQARDDAISFYKFHPVALRPIEEAGDVRPDIRRIQLHTMMGAARFNRRRFRFMRLHYQFVMANELRAGYDYFMLVCGPVTLEQTVRAPDGTAGLFGADGALLASPQA